TRPIGRGRVSSIAASAAHATIRGRENGGFMMTWLMATSAAVLALALGTEATVEERQHASGTVEVNVTPVASGDNGVVYGHITIAKTFAGVLAGTSKGDMWTASTAIEGSAGYVAIEKVEGKLRGQSGSFTLLHQGPMRRGGAHQIRIVVVPESGTGELAGLSGTMTIHIEKSAHFYEFDYTLPASK